MVNSLSSLYYTSKTSFSQTKRNFVFENPVSLVVKQNMVNHSFLNKILFVSKYYLFQLQYFINFLKQLTSTIQDEKNIVECR